MMELNAKSMKTALEFLDEANKKQWRFVAFDVLLANRPEAMVFHGFSSDKEAIDFCTGIQNIDAYVSGNNGQDFFQYMPVETLERSIGNTVEINRPPGELKEIHLEMALQNVYLLPSASPSQAEQNLASGSVVPVRRVQIIDPFKETDRFVLIEHHHAGHQVYEIGHSVRVIGTFSSPADAEALLQERLKWDTAMGYGNDYLIAGLYKDRGFTHNLEGWPDAHCGVVLKIASKVFDTDNLQKGWKIEEVNKLNESHQVSIYLYAKFDAISRNVIYLDGTLKETNPAETQNSTYPSHLITEQLTTKNAMIMNEKNYDYLKSQVKFMGFGEGLDAQLLENIKNQPEKFQLQHQTKFEKDEISSTLNFEKSKQSDMYFFQNFEMSVKAPGQEDALKQTYYVGKDHNITLKERHNMLQGRAVYKTFPRLAPSEEDGGRLKPTGETYQAWASLNFKETEGDGNFKTRKMFDYKLEETLGKFPVKELEDNYDKRRLIASLEKGNLTRATVTVDGEEKKVLIAANPKDNTVNFYDDNKQRIDVKQVVTEKLTEKQDETKTLKQQKGSVIQAPDQADATHAQKQADNINGYAVKDSLKNQPIEKQEEQNTGTKKRHGVKV